MLAILFILVLALAFLGSLPTWSYSGSWGYVPSGVLGIVMLAVLVMLVMGRIQGRDFWFDGLISGP